MATIRHPVAAVVGGIRTNEANLGRFFYDERKYMKEVEVW
jgi:hypothetical protein